MRLAPFGKAVDQVSRVVVAAVAVAECVVVADGQGEVRVALEKVSEAQRGPTTRTPSREGRADAQ